MKRIYLSAALCVLAACSEAPTVPGPDLGPQFVLTPGDPTWYFEGVVDREDACVEELGKVVKGTITFDDDATPTTDPMKGTFYYPRMSWDVTIGSVREQGSCAPSECGHVLVRDEVPDSDHGGIYPDELNLFMGDWGVLSVVEEAGTNLLEGIGIPAVPPTGGVRTLGYSCADGSAVPATLTRLETYVPPFPRTKADCKNDGWAAFGFKNQGQCVRFVETGKDSR